MWNSIIPGAQRASFPFCLQNAVETFHPKRNRQWQKPPVTIRKVRLRDDDSRESPKNCIVLSREQLWITFISKSLKWPESGWPLEIGSKGISGKKCSFNRANFLFLFSDFSGVKVWTLESLIRDLRKCRWQKLNETFHLNYSKSKTNKPRRPK